MDLEGGSTSPSVHKLGLQTQRTVGLLCVQLVFFKPSCAKR